MGSPGPRAFGSDVIETARCGASPCATRPRSGRSLWQEQVLLVDDRHGRSIAVTPTFHVETGAFDRDGQLASRRRVFVVEFIEEDAE
jgi:hypothetical protein